MRHPTELLMIAMAIFSQDPKVKRLRSLPALAPLKRRRLVALSQVFDEVAVRSGAVISRPGDTRVQFAVLEKGRAVGRLPDGEIKQVGRGEVLPDATVVAVEASRLLVAHPRHLASDIARLVEASNNQRSVSEVRASDTYSETGEPVIKV